MKYFSCFIISRNCCVADNLEYKSRTFILIIIKEMNNSGTEFAINDCLICIYSTG